MPPSQLKRLKSELRQSGVTGPQKSKQQKRKDAKDGSRQNLNASRAAALDNVREKFLPFEVKLSSRGPKHEVATNAKPKSAILGRPGQTKRKGEDLRREKLLTEMQQRQKTGGIMDRRFGENDPTMDPAQRALERFQREALRGSRKTGIFDLEGEGDDEEFLTHGGQALSFGPDSRLDDYEESVSAGSDDDPEEQAARRADKRRKLMERVERGDDITEQPDGRERPKSKAEVMKEVIAKSKLHKYERQQAKEDDDDLREKLDAQLPDINALLRGTTPKPAPLPAPPTQGAGPTMNADRAALLNGASRELLEKEYDKRLKLLAQDARGKPAARTKTEEEIAEEDARRLNDLEEARMRRMRGEESDEEGPTRTDDLDGNFEEGADEFGLGAGISAQRSHRTDIDVEDEDEFELDDDLIASGSELEVSSDDESQEDGSESEDGLQDEDEAEFLSGILGADDAGQPGTNNNSFVPTGANAERLSYTFPCPETHEKFLETTKGVESMELITIIQRIRTLYNPKLDGANKAKLATFAEVLVDHVAYLAERPSLPSFAVLEQVIRHIHSLGKTYPVAVGNAFRKHTIALRQERPLAVTAGDLVLFTAIGEIFSTSDHFHQVVTPNMLNMACYIGQATPKSLGDVTKAAYVCTQFLRYQRLSKRYIPEVLNSVVTSLEALAPLPCKKSLGQVPLRETDAGFRINTSDVQTRQTRFADINHNQSPSSSEGETLKHALLDLFVNLAAQMSELWLGKSAYVEIMTPVLDILKHLLSKPCSAKLPPATKHLIKSTWTKVSRLLAQARLDRQPLALHNHRPLPIKQSIPKFEEDYRPDRHYDPDRDRAELAKLKKEHKRERKGALRELRKDAHFISRESLRQKKVADAEYEKKYKRLVAEIQGEEAHEAKEYEREKRMRQGKR